MTLKTQIINFIINASKDEKFDGATLEKSSITSTFFIETTFTKTTANYFIQRHWMEIVQFKNEFMQEDTTDIFSCPEIFLNHLIRQYSRIILASITLDDNVVIDEYFRRKLENLMKI